MISKLDFASIPEIRRAIRASRRDLPLTERHAAEQAIFEKIKRHPRIKIAQHITIFRSFDGEIDTQPIIEYLWRQGKTVYLPVIHPFNSHHLLFLRYDQNTILKPNKLGILDPILNVKAVIPHSMIDVVLTPLVAFDSRCYRIGMGGGYYDRLLANYHKTTTYPIGLAFKCQQVEYIPNQPWDIQLPEIISA